MLVPLHFYPPHNRRVVAIGPAATLSLAVPGLGGAYEHRTGQTYRCVCVESRWWIIADSNGSGDPGVAWAQKADVAAAVGQTERFDFLLDVAGESPPPPVAAAAAPEATATVRLPAVAAVPAAAVAEDVRPPQCRRRCIRSNPPTVVTPCLRGIQPTAVKVEPKTEAPPPSTTASKTDRLSDTLTDR
eukprot:SAG11_NODE_2959_length_2809_cov_3.641328_3_plen_187_part_00